MACRFDRNCSNIAAGKFWAARLACFFRNLKVSPVIGFCPLASPQIWTAVSISAPCSRGNHCIFPPAHIPQPPSTPAPHEFHRCWFAAKPNRVNDITIPREKLVIRQAVLHAPCLGRQGRRPVEYHQACVDASRGDVRAAIGKDGNGLVFGHKKPPAGDRGGRALVRPGLLPIGRIPFREPPCAGTQVGEGIALPVSAQSVQARFNSSLGTDPIFRLVDGATCPTADVSSLQSKLQAYSLLLSRGLIRIGLPIPANAEFQVSVVSDPYSCNTNPATGLISPTSGIVAIYRRPLPSTDLGFLSAIMWDGREPNLFSQSIDATLGHAQANASPSSAQQQQIVDFENGVFTAQLFDNAAKNLNADGATGGPVALQGQLASFFIGVNDPLGSNPTGTPFTPNIFDLYQAWSSLPGTSGLNNDRKAVARGEAVFNATQINITGVAGLNDVLGVTSIPGFCGTCHDTPNVGNHSV